MTVISVIIPTRNRPALLDGCLFLPLVFGLIHAGYGCGLMVEKVVGRSRRRAWTVPVQPMSLQAISYPGQGAMWKRLSLQEEEGVTTNL